MIGKWTEILTILKDECFQEVPSKKLKEVEMIAREAKKDLGTLVQLCLKEF